VGHLDIVRFVAVKKLAEVTPSLLIVKDAERHR
jgi:hypothetical protein